MEKLDDLSTAFQSASLSKQPEQDLIKVSEEIKPGYFYRLNHEAGRKIIGVYAKSVKYHGIDLKCEGFRTIKQCVNDAVENNTDHKKSTIGDPNFLGVCFFGVWSNAEKNFYIIVEVPVCDGNGDICIWHTLKDSPIPVENCVYKSRTVQYSHTEREAVNYLKGGNVHNDLWKKFMDKTTEKRKSTNFKAGVLDCVGFHFYSNLDACDQCLLEDLIPFLNNVSPYTSDGHDPTFSITLTSRKLYRPDIDEERQTFLYNSCYSASLFFNQPLALLLESTQKLYTYKVEAQINEVKHQESVNIEERKKFDFIVLTVNNGEPVKISHT